MSGGKSLVAAMYAVELALIGLNTSGKYTTNGSRYRAMWAASVATLALSLLADVSPQLGGALAVLVALAVWRKNPGEIGAAVSGATAQTPSSTQASASGG